MKLDANNYVDEAERVIKRLAEKKDRNGRSVPMVTTSKIRNLLAMTADIYNEVVNYNGDVLPREIVERISYLRIRFTYEAGRESAVKSLVEEAEILECIKGIGASKEKYILFSRYMEALVAFRKYYGGRDE